MVAGPETERVVEVASVVVARVTMMPVAELGSIKLMLEEVAHWVVLGLPAAPTSVPQKREPPVVDLTSQEAAFSPKTAK